MTRPAQAVRMRQLSRELEGYRDYILPTPARPRRTRASWGQRAAVWLVLGTWVFIGLGSLLMLIGGLWILVRALGLLMHFIGGYFSS